MRDAKCETRDEKLTETNRNNSLTITNLQLTNLWKENEALKQELTSLKQMIDDNTVIIGQAVLSQLELAFPDREIDDALIQSILIKGIRQLKAEEEERKKLEILRSLQNV